jgi:S-adenosylmethionine decarboxylase
MKAQMFNKKFWINETDPEKLKKIYKQKLINSGFIICKFSEHYFNPYGYTAFFLLSESHLAIHTFPEENKTYIELSSCVKQQFKNFINGHNI